MPTKIRRRALCVRIFNGICWMINEDDLSAVEVRREFDGARVGQWYRLEWEKGGKRRRFEPIVNGDQSQKPLLPVKLAITQQYKDGSMPFKRINQPQIQVCLPIVFVPDFSILGWNWKSNFAKEEIFYSHKLEGHGKIECELDCNRIETGIQYWAYLTLHLNAVECGEGEFIPPEWTLDSQQNIQNNLDIPEVAPSCIPPAKDSGIVLKITDDQEKMLAVLCLRDGQLAFARQPFSNFSVGQPIHFKTIELNCFTHPIRMAVDLSAADDHCFNELPVRKLECDQQFELQFPLTEHMLNSKMASHRLEQLGNLLDVDGKLSPLQFKERDMGKWLVIKARLCTVAEQQWPLWVMTEFVQMASADQILKGNGADVGRNSATTSIDSENHRSIDRRRVVTVQKDDLVPFTRDEYYSILRGAQ